jgi:hypothetical protein
MKRRLKGVIMTVAAVGLLLAVTTAAADRSVLERPKQQRFPNETAFSIPMNNYCSNENDHDFSFQLSNTGDKPAELTVSFYQLNGNLFNEEGTSYREMQSTLKPGTAFTLAPHATALYHNNFGNSKSCNERVYMGRIVVNSGQASLVASGWVNENDRVDVISIRNGVPFILQAADEPKAAATPAAAGESQ